MQKTTPWFFRLHSMLKKSSNRWAILVALHVGKLCLQYCKDQWKINQRTELRGHVPDDEGMDTEYFSIKWWSTQRPL